MHNFSKDDIPQAWRELLGDYFETVQWHQLQKNLQAELDLHSELASQYQQSVGARRFWEFTQRRLAQLGQARRCTSEYRFERKA